MYSGPIPGLYVHRSDCHHPLPWKPYTTILCKYPPALTKTNANLDLQVLHEVYPLPYKPPALLLVEEKLEEAARVQGLKDAGMARMHANQERK